jgi:predicted carbohydrate-binding protein with CBM5 and CBM33 domain
MNNRIRLATIVAGVVAAPLIIIALRAGPAGAHGWITSPPSRQDHCNTGKVADCGLAASHPEGVADRSGSLTCSGGSPQFAVLDDESKNWPVTSIGSSVTMQWNLTILHRTSNWEYLVDDTLFKTFDQGNTVPAANISHELTGLPAGRHKILARWNLADVPGIAFYSCMDVNVSGS